MTANLLQQFVPQLHKRMGLLLQQEAYLVGHHRAVADQHAGHVLEGVRHLARSVDHPRLLSLAQEVLQALADNAPARVNHQVGHIALVVLHQTDGFVQVGVHGLPRYQHGASGLHEHTAHMAQHVRRHVGRRQFYRPFHRQHRRREVEQRFRNRHIDVHRPATLHQCLVDQPVAVPTALAVVRLRQGDGLADETAQRVGLGHRLTVQLVYPLRRAICADSHQGHMLIISLSDSRRQIEQRRA